MFAQQSASFPTLKYQNLFSDSSSTSDLPSLLHDILVNVVTAASQTEASNASSTSAAPAASGPSSSLSKTLRPRLDLYTSASSDIITALIDLPGFSKAEVSIAVLADKLVVSAGSSPAEGKAKDEAESGIEWQVRERRSGQGKFFRELPLASGIKTDQIKASMQNGVLTITYPKAAAPTEAQKVLIE